MKKKTAVSIAVLAAVLAIAGVCYIYNWIFPKAPPIVCPNARDIVSVTLNSYTDQSVSMSESDYENMLSYIDEAKSTRIQSVNDCPYAEVFYRIDINTNEEQLRYFIYEDKEQVYIEMPYRGVYKSGEELLNLVLEYFVQ